MRIPAIAAGAALMAGLIQAAEPEERIDAFRAQFDPTKPTVVVRYGLEYRFKSIRLIRVAQGVIRTTEGVWHSPAAGTNRPAFFMEASIDTYDQATGRRKRVSIHDHMVSVLTNPDADTLLYIRSADQRMNPIFGQRRSSRHLKVYDLECGNMDYYHEDYLRGLTNSVLNGSTNLMRQGREVAGLMKLMSAVYLREQPPVTFTNSPTIYVDMDAEVRPFVAQTRFSQVRTAITDGRMPGLRVDVKTSPECKGAHGRLITWITSLRELSAKVKDADLIKAADESPPWSIVPLAFEYDLTIGCLYGAIQEIHVSAFSTNAPVCAGVSDSMLQPDTAGRDDDDHAVN